MLILIILGSFLWRLRGGLLNDLTGQANYLGFNDTVVRIIWSVGMSLAFWLLSPDAGWIWPDFFGHFEYSMYVGFVFLAISLFAGTTLVGWYGANLLPTALKDIVFLSLSGFVRMLFPAIVLFSPWPLVAGLLFGPVYWLGAKLPKPYSWMFWGEILTGAMIGFFLSFS